MKSSHRIKNVFKISMATRAPWPLADQDFGLCLQARDLTVQQTSGSRVSDPVSSSARVSSLDSRAPFRYGQLLTGMLNPLLVYGRKTPFLWKEAVKF